MHAVGKVAGPQSRDIPREPTRSSLAPNDVKLISPAAEKPARRDENGRLAQPSRLRVG
jgi:hypothetical protein